MSERERKHTGVLTVSSMVYRLLLRRYPAAMRRSFGDEMLDIFETELRRTLEDRGLSGLPGLWWRTGRDLARPLPRPVHRREGTTGEGRPPRQAADDGVGGGSWIAAAREDLVFAARSLRREPRFTSMVVGVLAIGLALNVVAFAVINAYLLRPLPFPEADRIVAVQNAGALSWNEVDDVFEQAVSWDLDVFTIIGDGRPELAPGAWVTPGFLETYGIRAQLGRTFRADEAGDYGAPVAMISHRLWQQRFAGDPDIIGRIFSAFTSDRPDHAESFTIVGVLSSDFWYTNDYTEVLSPLREDRSVYGGRLRAGLPPATAATRLTEMAALRMERVPADYRVSVELLQERHVASIRPTLLVMQAAVLLVLLIACANAAVLTLVRSTRRERELGLRRALGASGPRLARQLMFEGGLIAAGAAATALGLAVLAIEGGRAGMQARLGLSVPGGLESLGVDGTVVGATVVLTVAVATIFAAVPLLSALPRALASTFAEGSRGGTESLGRRRARNVMVVGEVALSLALLTGAGLMVRSALHLQSQDLGFDPSNVVRGQMGLRQASYPEAADRVAAFDRLRESLASAPGVEEVGLASMGLFTTRFAPRPTEGLGGGDVTRAQAVRWYVGERYFDVMGIELLRGRTLEIDDGLGAEVVAVVSESLAGDLWGEDDPLGAMVRLGADEIPGTAPSEPEPWARVVGIVADVTREVDPEPVGDLYFAYRQAAPNWMNAFVRFRGDPGDVEATLQAAVDVVDSEIPLASVRRIDEVVEEAMQPTRYFAALLAGFSAFALLLAILGLYGVISYAARQRQKVIAIRVALGADRGSVVRLFVREGLAVIALGLVLGTVGGVALGRALESQLFGVRPGDPATHVILATVLALGALAAVWVPARRASTTDPMRVLREE